MHTFELTIQRRRDATWPVIVEEHAGDGSLAVRVEGELELDQHRLLGLDADPAAYGEALGRAVFTERIRDAFAEALARAPERLRVLVFVEDQSLRGLRWERLRAPVDGQWRLLATFQRAPLTRYLPSLTDRRFHPIGRRDLRALILAASPPGLARFGLSEFDAAAAVESARTALGSIPAIVLADMPDAYGRPTLDALCAALTAEPITLLHIVAHGRVLQDGESVVYLAGAESNAAVDPVTCTRLVERLSALQSARGLPHFSFLATCESASPDADEAMGGLGQRLVVELGMPAVVAMADKVSVTTATALSSELYRRLREHGEPDRALVEATAGLAEQGDVMVPALFSRLGGRPLFSEHADRPLSAREVESGLERLAELLPARAPVLAPELAAVAATLRATGQTRPELLSAEARAERADALDKVGTICAEATELSFSALALSEAPPAYDERCPFPGLCSFGTDEERFFFGREPLVARLAERVASFPFLAVLGPSGSGKSSVVFAGLVPALRRRSPTLPFVSFTPGELPLASMLFALEHAAIAQGDAAPRALMVIDQFEELFTLCTDQEERRAFLQELLRMVGPYQVVITMRADFWGEVAPFRELRELVQAHQELVPPMAPEELRRSIELQAAAVGLRFEADLGGAILDDVRGEPGAMPLLQHALQELWQRRRGRWLRAAEYRAIGGVQRAIAHTADAIFNRCPPEEQERLRAIFMRLTRLDREGGEERRDTRQRATLSELVPAGADPAATQSLVSRLVSARLLMTSGAGSNDVVEVAHEALIRSWPRLRGWLSEDRQALLLRESIQQAAHEWEVAGRDENLLFRGTRLDEAAALGTQQRFALNALEWSFLDAGTALRDREAQEREEARQRELESARLLAETEARRAQEAQAAAEHLRRRGRVLKIVATVAIVLMLVAAGAGVSAVAGHAAARVQAEAAEAARAEAEGARILAERARAEAENAQSQAERARDRANRLAMTTAQLALVAESEAAMEHDDPELALALALASAESSNPASKAYLTLALAADSGPRRRFDNFERSVTAVAFSPGGDLMIAGDAEGNLRAWHPATGQELRAFKAPAGITGFAFLPDRSRIVVSTFGGEIVLLDAIGGGDLVAAGSFAGGDRAPILAIALAADGRTLYTGARSGRIERWDVTTQRFLGAVGARRRVAVTDLGLDDSGRLMVLFGDGELQLIDPGGEQPTTALLLDQQEGLGPSARTVRCEARAMARIPGSQSLLVACDHGVVQRWSLERGELEAVFRGHDSSVLSLAVTPDGAHFVSSSYDQSVRLWDLRRGIEVRRYLGHSGEVNGVALSPDGRSLLTGSFDATARQWDLHGAQLLRDLVPLDVSGGMQAQARFSADGSSLVTLIDQRKAMRWQAESGAAQRAIELPQPALALSDDGHLALVGTPGELTVIELEEGTTVSVIPGEPRAREVWASFSPDQRHLLASFDEMPLRLYRIADGVLIRQFPLDRYQGGALSIAFSPDGKLALTGTNNYYHPAVRLWEVATGRLIARLEGHHDEVRTVAFSPDGRWAISGSWDQTARLWDLETFHTAMVFAGHSRSLLALAMSRNGKLLLTGSEDNTARLWDVATGQELARLSGHAGDVQSVAFDPFGQTAATATTEGEVLLWNVRTGLSMAKWARANRYVPALDCHDLRRYALPCAVN